MSDDNKIRVRFTRNSSPYNAGDVATFLPSHARQLLRGDRAKGIKPAAVLYAEDPAAIAEAKKAVDGVPDAAAVADAKSRLIEADAKKDRKAAHEAELREAAAVVAEAWEGMVKELVDDNTRDELDLKAVELEVVDPEEMPNKAEVATAILVAQGHTEPVKASAE